MKKGSRKIVSEPTIMIHHVREIQLRFLAIIVILIVGMGVGYVYYEALFSLIKAPLNGPLHYMSPAGSFNFVIKVCLLVGVVVALPMAIYQMIMFAQPALVERLSRTRVYIATLSSLLLASAGAAFAFLVIIPMALRFFHKFQVDGLIALISADEYLRFVVNVVITFVLIFQLPLVISFIDHIKPLSPKKLFKAEKFIIVGSLFVGVLVPFAFDPLVQLLIASPIIVLYNLSIGIVLLQKYMRERKTKKALLQSTESADGSIPKESLSRPRRVSPVQPISKPSIQAAASRSAERHVGQRQMRDIHQKKSFAQHKKLPLSPVAQRPIMRTGRLITDIRPHSLSSTSRPSVNIATRPAVE